MGRTEHVARVLTGVEVLRGEVGAGSHELRRWSARVDEDGLLDGLFERVGDRGLKAERRALGGGVVPGHGTAAHAGRLEEDPAEPRTDWVLGLAVAVFAGGTVEPRSA